VPASITPADLQAQLQNGAPLALVDVREHGEYNASHIPGASSLPRRLIEFRFSLLVPNPAVPVVVCDDDGRRAALAARTLERMGYTHVSVLAGGLSRWASEGFRTEWGMNVPSKAFGERIEAEHDVPTIEPLELNRRLQSGEPITILDSRTPEEYRQFCIPGGRSLPGGELAFRVGSLLRQAPDQTIVVNCAGRTRSIIGTRILQRLGLTNVVGLKNGTAGWTLSGLQLEHGADRVTLPEPDPTNQAAERAFADRLIEEDGVQRLSVDELQTVLAGANRGADCTYLVDVRTDAEYAAGHIPGFTWFPGGQAVQRADDLVVVRAAHAVFCCDDLVRGAVTASWFRQMGFPHVSVVEGSVNTWRQRGLPLATGAEKVTPFGVADAQAAVPALTPAELADHLAATETRPIVLYVDTSALFARGHVPGARWVSRSWLELQVGGLAPDRERLVVVTDPDGRGAALAARTLLDLGYQRVAFLGGGMRAWQAAGQPVEEGLSGVMLPPDDVLLAGPDRSVAEAVEYLRWETALGPGHAPATG
jgi:rhodanese-related sulfurtransferase